MLIPPIQLACVCVVLWLVGAVLAYMRPRLALVPIAAVLVIAWITISKLRDPLGIPPPYRHYTENWDYLLALYSSFAVGVPLPVVGVYLGKRK